MNTPSSRYKSNFQAYEYMATNFSETNGIFDTIAKLNREEKAYIEDEMLLEWRKNLKLVRERSQS
jgi:hypothetical protein